jgi:hypothetical protein
MVATVQRKETLHLVQIRTDRAFVRPKNQNVKKFYVFIKVAPVGRLQTFLWPA